MEQLLSPLERVIQKKCSDHKHENLDQIDLTGESQSGRLCKICIQEKKIPVEQYFSINELFALEKGELFYFYPLEYEEIIDQIQKYCINNEEKDKIDLFFRNLRENIEEAIQVAENRAKKDLIYCEDQSLKLLTICNEIGEIDKLKDLLVSESKDLNSFLLKKWQNSKQNEQALQKCFKNIKYNTCFLDLSQGMQKIEELTKSLKEFSLFTDQGDNIIDSIEIYSPSKFIKIEKSNDTIQCTNNSTKRKKGICYFEEYLDAFNKYIIQLEINTTNNSSPGFGFGLVKSNNNSEDISESNIYYYENESSTISEDIPEGFKIGKKRLEIRIDLKNKIVKVSSPPSYKNVFEFHQEYNIDEYSEYSFAMELQSGDSVKILEVLEVPSFNDDM